MVTINIEKKRRARQEREAQRAALAKATQSHPVVASVCGLWTMATVASFLAACSESHIGFAFWQILDAPIVVRNAFAGTFFTWLMLLLGFSTAVLILVASSRDVTSR